MVLHPPIQDLLAGIRECIARAASNPPQLDPELFAQQASKGQAQGRSFCIPAVMGLEALAKRGSAWRFAIGRWSLGRDAHIQERVITMPVTGSSIHKARHLTEIPGIDTSTPRDETWASEYF